MIITRKIEIVINESDKKKKKEFSSKIYRWRDLVRRAANIAISHKCVQKNLADYEYLTQEMKDKVTKENVKVSDIIEGGPGHSISNITYRKMVQVCNGEVPSDIISSLNQMIGKTFDKTYNLVRRGETSVRTYKNDIPIPFGSRSIRKLEYVKDLNYFTFTLFGIPFKTFLGRDKSNNKSLLLKLEEEYKKQQEQNKNKDSKSTKDNSDASSVQPSQPQPQTPKYKLCSSSLVIETKNKNTKMFLLLCVDMPKQLVITKKEKTLYAFLSVNTPILCSSNPAAIEIMSKTGQFELHKNMMELATKMESYDKVVGENVKKMIKDLYFDNKVKNPHITAIGTKEEYLYRRLQIQDAVRRCQKTNRYSNGGRGRKKKCQAIERWHDKEKNFTSSKLHTYAKLLVMEARRQECSTIVLCNQEWKEMDAKSESEKGQPFLLRNWSYYGLKDKIKYKAEMFGIKVAAEEQPKAIVVYFDNDEYKYVKKFANAIHGQTYKITSEDSKITDCDSYDIVYVSLSDLDQNLTGIVESFLINNVNTKQVVVPFTSTDKGNLSQITENAKKQFSSYNWVEGISLSTLSEKEMKTFGKKISDLQQTAY